MLAKFEQPIYVTRPLLPPIGEIEKQLADIWKSKWLTNNGSKHKELEEKIKAYLNVENLVLFSNGTLALLLGIKALELSGEVITTPFTFPATTEALDWNGLSPVFCDIEAETFNIDADKIEALITEKTTAILAVHVFGNPCNVKKIQAIADQYHLKVIYDGAHAFGSSIDGNPIGSYGDMTMFSFHATKLFNTIEGGALTFKDENLTQKLNLLKNFGITGPEHVVLSGINCKLNEIQSAMGLEVLKIVPEERARRRKIKEAYEKGLASVKGIRLINHLEDKESSYQYYTIEVNAEKYGKSRDWLHEKLKEYNIFTRKYFYPLCSDFAWYKSLPSAQASNLLEAHKIIKNSLSMPYYGELKLDEVEKICGIIEDLQATASQSLR